MDSRTQGLKQFLQKVQMPTDAPEEEKYALREFVKLEN